MDGWMDSKRLVRHSCMLSGCCVRSGVLIRVDHILFFFFSGDENVGLWGMEIANARGHIFLPPSLPTCLPTSRNDSVSPPFPWKEWKWESDGLAV